MSTVGELCTREVVVITRNATAVEAARTMRDHHVGALVVVADHHQPETPVGIITDRDLALEILAVDLDGSEITVGEMMGSTLVIAHDHEQVSDVLDRMRYRGVHRLPVVNARGHLVGIVVCDDLLEAIANDLTALSGLSRRSRAREAAQRKPVAA